LGATSIVRTDTFDYVSVGASFDAFGNLRHQVAGDGSTIDFTYDADGRQLSRSSSVDGTSCFLWDAAAGRGVGQLASATSPDGITESFAYDDVGRATVHSWAIDGETFTTTSHYDWMGRLNSLDYPSVAGAPAVTALYSYGAAGLLQNVTVPNPAGGAPLFTASVSARDAQGRVRNETAGNSLVSTTDYGPLGGVSQTLVKGGPGAAVLEQHQFHYDADGVLNERDDLTPNVFPTGVLAESFAHDSLHRLKTWTTSGVNVRYGYDDMGNMTSRNDGVTVAGTSWTPSLTAPHQIASSNDGTVFGYDLRGNMTRTGERATSFTSFGLPKTIDSPGTSGTTVHSDFRYDASGSRILKTTETPLGWGRITTRTLTLGSLYERVGGAWLTPQIFRIAGPGGLSGELVYNSWGGFVSRYRFADHLGSATLVTDADGNVQDRQKFDPFGRRIQPNAPQSSASRSNSTYSTGFTGQDHDDEHGLINMRGRMYDPNLGRFISPDPVMGDATLSQRWNRYSYVMNSPMALVDPSGYDEAGVDINTTPTTLEGGRTVAPGSGMFFQADPLYADRSVAADLAAVDTPQADEKPEWTGAPSADANSEGGAAGTGGDDSLVRAGKGAAGFALGTLEPFVPFYVPIPGVTPSTDRDFTFWRGLGQVFGGGASIIVGVLEGTGGTALTIGGGASSVVDGPIGVGAAVVGIAIDVDAGRRIAQGVAGVVSGVVIMAQIGGTEGSGPKRSSAGRLQSEIERGQAPKGVDRVDKGRGPYEKDHVHFGKGEQSSALNNDGTWKHNPQKIPGAVKDWLGSHGWSVPND
jgi:RHS repeat-associated protein